MSTQTAYIEQAPQSLKIRWMQWRNRVLSSKTFHAWAIKLPIFRLVSERKASYQMDMITGFAHARVMYIFVETGIIPFMNDRLCHEDEIRAHLGMSAEATRRILMAGKALNLVESPEPGLWIYGEVGATLSANEGALAIIKHHQLLYQDLVDAIGLFTRPRGQDTSLSSYWHYAIPEDEKPDAGGPYSELMAATQPMVWQQIIDRYPFGRHEKMLDIGGGAGAFAEAIGTANTNLSLGVFDLPEVVPYAQQRFAGTAMEKRISFHPGSFRKDPLPTGYDLMTLIRILHDHDDDVADTVMAKAWQALPAGGKLLIVEPMADTRGAKLMGDSFFGLYLWSMGSGRPRSAKEYHQRLKKAGFTQVRNVKTPVPVVAKAIVATK